MYPRAPLAALFVATSDPANVVVTGLLEHLPPGGHVGRRHAIDLPKADPDTGESLGLRPCPFAALLVLWGPHNAPLPALRTLADRVACGYRHVHADPAVLGGLPPTDRFDGDGMVFFRDAAHAAAARSLPEIARDATRDGMQFVDHSNSMLAMFAF